MQSISMIRGEIECSQIYTNDVLCMQNSGEVLENSHYR